MDKLYKIIISLSKAHFSAAQAEFSRIGLTQGQPKVLDHLVLHNGCIQKDIADYCRIEPATVSSLLANMEKSGLVYRVQSKENRRILKVFLTEKGFTAQNQVAMIFEHLNEQCLKGFTPEEQEMAMQLMLRIRKNLEEGGADNA